MQSGNQFVLRSNKDVDFIGALAQNAAKYADINMPPQVGGRNVLRSIAIVSKQNLAWELVFFRIQTPPDTSSANYINSYQLAGRWAFQAGDGVQIGAAGPFLYYIDGLSIPVEDWDDRLPVSPQPLRVFSSTTPPRLHCALVNRSAAVKNGDSSGEILIDFRLEPTSVS